MATWLHIVLPVAWSKIIITTSLFVSFSISSAFSAVLLLLSPALPLFLPLSYTQRPKVQAHHLLISQKECNEIINVPELIMNMIKKAKISGAGLSLPIHSQGLLSFREGEPKKPSSRAHSGSVHPACLSCRLCCCGRSSSPSIRAASRITNGFPALWSLLWCSEAPSAASRPLRVCKNSSWSSGVLTLLKTSVVSETF